jgi:benzoyl-CoA reductase subunit C
VPFLKGELERFKKSIEDWTGKKISNEDLDRGIEIMNKNRRLMKQIYELRKGEKPPLTGLEAMYIVVSGQMVIGSEDDDTAFINLVESLGATFVVDDHCTGTRYFWNEVEPKEDRLEAIAERYVTRPACPSKDWPDRTRLPHILNLAKDYNVSGAILIQQKFCDPHEMDIPAINKYLKENGIPSLFLEFDVTVPMGQFKIRTEAFLEMLSEEDLF